ncbi:hypothetical protein N7462_008999 [Penicillium macrosclerotiorum]|uniref:uncharacterized protein n=1 Tax=Penicillium macrosclerotiorum TaxID=303699 RepID=UPI0025497CC3|nr:uncharacterized protein N7462_008999 [Penicillium macrosclerotiorum]KAJ5676102.1 hypothetical protein N7462_008999 [Penicillium macrosclerotiorum]
MDASASHQPPRALSRSTPLPQSTCDPRLNRPSGLSNLQLTRTADTPISTSIPLMPPVDQTPILPSQSSLIQPDQRVSAAVGREIQTKGLGDLVPILTRLMDLTVARALKENQKATLADINASHSRSLEVAKSYSSFPACVQSFQTLKDAGQSSVHKLDQDLEQQETLRSQLCDELQGLFRQLPMTSRPAVSQSPITYPETEKIAELEAKNKELEAKLEVALTTKLENSLTAKFEAMLAAKVEELTSSMTANSANLADLELRVPMLEKTVNSQSTSNGGMNKRIGRVEQWKAAIEKGEIQLPSKPGSSEPTPQSADYQELRNEMATLNQTTNDAHKKFGDMESMITTMKAQLEELNQSTPAMQEQVTSLNNRALLYSARLSTMEPKFQEFDDALTRIAKIEQRPIPSAGAGPPIPEELARYTASIQRMESDHRHFWDSYNDLRSRLSQSMESAHQIHRNADSLKSLKQTVDTFMRHSDKRKEVTDTLVCAIRSLETRYNNISSEQLVKKMVAAMHEMNPSIERFTERMDTMNGEIAALRTANPGSAPSLSNERLDQFRAEILDRIEPYESSVRDLATTLTKSVQEVNEVQNTLETLGNAVAELGDSVINIEQYKAKCHLLSENLQTLKTNFEDIVGQQQATTVSMSQMRMLQETQTCLTCSSSEDLNKLKESLDQLENDVQDLRAKAFARNDEASAIFQTTLQTSTQTETSNPRRHTSPLQSLSSNRIPTGPRNSGGIHFHPNAGHLQIRGAASRSDAEANCVNNGPNSPSRDLSANTLDRPMDSRVSNISPFSPVRSSILPSTNEPPLSRTPGAVQPPDLASTRFRERRKRSLSITDEDVPMSSLSPGPSSGSDVFQKKKSKRAKKRQLQLQQQQQNRAEQPTITPR